MINLAEGLFEESGPSVKYRFNGREMEFPNEAAALEHIERITKGNSSGFGPKIEKVTDKE